MSVRCTIAPAEDIDGFVLHTARTAPSVLNNE